MSIRHDLVGVVIDKDRSWRVDFDEGGTPCRVVFHCCTFPSGAEEFTVGVAVGNEGHVRYFDHDPTVPEIARAVAECVLKRRPLGVRA